MNVGSAEDFFMRLIHHSNSSQVDLKVKVFSLSLGNANILTTMFRSSLVSVDLVKKFEFFQNNQITFANLYEFFYYITKEAKKNLKQIDF